jgi:hypothetical protein
VLPGQFYRQHKLATPLGIGGFGISRGSDDLSETMTVEPVNWRTPLIRYLENSGHVIDT